MLIFVKCAKFLLFVCCQIILFNIFAKTLNKITNKLSKQNSMKKLFRNVAIVALSIVAISCSKDENQPAQQTITEIAVATPDFSTLVTALTRTDLDGVLDEPGTYTVFAPTNAAFNTFFASLGANVTVDNVDVNVLKSILLNHVIGSEIKSAAIPASVYVSTLSPINATTNAPTISMFVQKSGMNVFINGGTATTGVRVTTADVDASNGVIHIVNAVIPIPTVVTFAAADPNFSTLVAALTRDGNTTDFVSVLSGTGPFTVFAPTNDAFGALLTELDVPNLAAIPEPTLDAVLKYHVASGNVRSSALTPNGVTTVTSILGANSTFNITLPGTGGNIANVIDLAGRASGIVAVDVQAGNGVIHVLNRVLLVP
jgi:uncharacterized surface protein with fasciclin (FAS1) repeats